MYKDCKNCPDRSISPNCHSTCETYLAMKKEREERNKKRHKEASYVDYYYETKLRMKKQKNKNYWK